MKVEINTMSFPLPQPLSGTANPAILKALNQRTREIFRHIVDAYVETGEPVGSRTLSRRLGLGLSSATIRNIMADLEEAGLIRAPHISAGRLPTQAGLRFFVDGLLEIGALGEEERAAIEAQCRQSGQSMQDVLGQATQLLSGLSACAGLVLAPKLQQSLRHIEFVALSPGRALVVLVNEQGMVENRVLDVPPGVPTTALIQASNYLNARLEGNSLDDLRQKVAQDIKAERHELDQLTTSLVENGLAVWAGGSGTELIVRGQARLLEDIAALEDLERVRSLFEALETKEGLVKLLDATQQAEGVQIFIGSENTLFTHAGCSMVVAPLANSQEKIVGAIGVLGPSRLNYARIIPMVDYTAKVVSELLG
jgi:heat-inducible transcriptional repressor